MTTTSVQEKLKDYEILKILNEKYDDLVIDKYGLGEYYLSISNLIKCDKFKLEEFINNKICLNVYFIDEDKEIYGYPKHCFYIGFVSGGKLIDVKIDKIITELKALNINSDFILKIIAEIWNRT